MLITIYKYMLKAGELSRKLRFFLQYSHIIERSLKTNAIAKSLCYLLQAPSNDAHEIAENTVGEQDASSRTCSGWV